MQLQAIRRSLARTNRLLALAVLVIVPAPGHAQQDLFAPAITVNSQVVTTYELRQRILFLQVLRQPGDVTKMAHDGLIDDRLYRDTAKKLDVSVTPEEVNVGMTEFAARANLSTDDFLKAVAQGGVEPATFRDFVQAGLLWRAAIRARFAGHVIVTDAEIDRAIADGAASGGDIQVLLSEIVIPTGKGTDAVALAARIKANAKTEAAFGIAAQSYSKAGTAKAGGALDWISVKSLPPEVAPRILALKPGEVTDPISVAGAVELFRLRDISQSAGDAKGPPEVDYAVLTQATGTDLATLRNTVVACDNLYPLARGLPAEALQRQTVLESAVPANLRATIAGLDAGEAAVVTGLSGQAELVMLCSRAPQSTVAPSRDDVRTDLLNRKAGLLAAAYLEELRSDAIIRDQ